MAELSIIWDRTWDDPVAFYTFVLGIFTALLAVVSASQIGFLFRADRTARLTAEAARSAADTSRSALIDIQRALIIPTKFQYDQLLRGSQVVGYYITAVLENTGGTIAKNFTGTANILMWDGPLPDDFKYPDRAVAAGATAYIGPHVPCPYGIGIAIQDVADVMNKKRRGFFYGWVEYDDIFGFGSKRRTEFCVEFAVIGNPHRITPPGTPTKIFEVGNFGRYNAIDADCYYKPGDRPPIGGLPEPTQIPPEQPPQVG